MSECPHYPGRPALQACCLDCTGRIQVDSAGHEWHTVGTPNYCALCGMTRLFRRVNGSGQPEYEYFVVSGHNARQNVPYVHCRGTHDKRPSIWERLLRDDPV